MNRILKKIGKGLSQVEDIRAVILYGSYARNEITSRSDIDLFILTTEKNTIKEIEKKIISLETETGRSIQPTIRTMKQLSKTDTGLLQNIFQEGKIIYLKEPVEIPATVLLKQKPQVIYSFQLSNLSQNEKARFNNRFYGRNKNKYQYKGLLGEISGKKLSPGCVMILYKEKPKIEKFFKKFKIKYEQLKVWK